MPSNNNNPTDQYDVIIVTEISDHNKIGEN